MITRYYDTKELKERIIAKAHFHIPAKNEFEKGFQYALECLLKDLGEWDEMLIKTKGK